MSGSVTVYGFGGTRWHRVREDGSPGCGAFLGGLMDHRTGRPDRDDLCRRHGCFHRPGVFPRPERRDRSEVQAEPYSMRAPTSIPAHVEAFIEQAAKEPSVWRTAGTEQPPSDGSES